MWLAACRILIFVAKSFKFLLAFPPVGVHLYEQSQEDLLLEEILHVDPCLGADLLEGLAAFPDYDALLGVTHDIYHGADVVSLLTFLELFHDNLAAVWNLLLVVEENLLAYDFRCEETEILVCEHILVIPSRSIREICHDCVKDVVEVELNTSKERKLVS